MARKSFYYLAAPTLTAALAFAPFAFAQTNSSTTENNSTATENSSTSTRSDSGPVSNAYHKAKGAVSDADLHARVAMALHENKYTHGHDINIDANHGTVTLSGPVPTEEVAKQAVRAAEHTRGVEHVRNDMTVTGTASSSRVHHEESSNHTNSSGAEDSSSSTNAQ
jgi:uncharacterized protein